MDAAARVRGLARVVLLFPLFLGATACDSDAPPAGTPEGAAPDRPAALPGPRPDVLVVVVDTLRSDRMPFLGAPRELAPFLDDLARDAVVFEAAHSASSWTAPATASIFTSLYPFQHGVRMGLGIYRQIKEDEAPELTLNRLPGGVETLPELLRSLGYRTFGIADNPNLCAAEGFDRGFDRFAGSDYEGAPHVNEVLAGWADEIADARPWFVYLHYMDPHAPYNERAPWFRRPRDRSRLAEKKARYDSEVRFLDEHLRRAFELLGVGGDTLVVFTADHGEELGEHGNTGHGFKLYSELIRVPLLVRLPGAPPAVRRVPHDVSTLDLLPTLRELLGAPPAPELSGTSLVPYWRDEAAPEPRTLFAMRTQEKDGRTTRKWAVVHDGWKVVQTEPEGGAELFDLRADPGELRDVAADHPERVAALLALRAELEARAPRWAAESSSIPLDDETLQSLRDLGYAGEDDGG